MQVHRNARLTPLSRGLLVDRVRKEHWRVTEAAEAAGVSRQTAHKWLRRFDAGGAANLEDRTSRPRRIHRTSRRTVRRIEQLRRRRKTAPEIAAEIDVASSTVSKVLGELGLNRIWRVEESLDPPRRYEHSRPGGLLHIDAKKLARIGRIGHRIHGDYRRRKRGVGWEVAFVCVDDHTRLAYSEVHPSENAESATAFLGRALRWFQSLGIRCERILSDNAKCYSSKHFTALCRQHQLRQCFTRPYTPQTNGKAERFIQTLTRRWAHRTPYRTSALRTAALPAWINHYNHRRPHRAIGGRPPIARLRDARQQPL